MRRKVQSIGGVFALIAFALLLVSILTHNWLEITVDRTVEPALTDGGLATYSRRRGLYQECWSDAAAQSVAAGNEFKSSTGCIYLDLGVLNKQAGVTYDSEYQARSGLLIAMWAVLGLTALFIFIAVILYLYTLCRHVNNYEWKYGTKASAGLMLAAMLFNGLGMGLYHGAEHLELNTITDPSGTQAPYAMFFPADMPQNIEYRTVRMYSWSYALSWCALACELLASVLFMSVSCCYVKSAKKSVYKKSVPKQSTTVVVGRAPSYEMVHEKVVVAPPQVYVVGNDNEYYQDRRGSYDPYTHGQPNNGYSPSYNYDKGWVVQ